MEGDLTGTPSRVICPLYVVVNQQSVQGKGGMAGGYSVRGEDVAEHSLELMRSPKLLQDFG